MRLWGNSTLLGREDCVRLGCDVFNDSAGADAAEFVDRGNVTSDMLQKVNLDFNDGSTTQQFCPFVARWHRKQDYEDTLNLNHNSTVCNPQPGF